MRALRLLAITLLLSAALAPSVLPAEERARKEPAIVVSGEGDAAIAPDLAIVSLGVSTP
jgi:uncharacterized protein YggE